LPALCPGAACCAKQGGGQPPHARTANEDAALATRHSTHPSRCPTFDVLAAKPEPAGKDPGFEEMGAGDRALAHWDFFSSKIENIAVVTDTARSGERAIRLQVQGVKNAGLGVGQALPVTPKATYTFRAWVMNDKQDKLAGSAAGNLGIEWYDQVGDEIARVASKEWGPTLSKMRWQEFSVEAKAPPYATKVKFAIYLRDGDKMAKGACFVDDAEILVEK
jgi:hypothetical protein